MSDFSLTIDEAHPQFVWLAPPEQEKVRAGDMVFEDVGLNDIYCLPENRQHCWIIGEFGYLFRTEDGGVTWERGEILSGNKIDPLIMRDRYGFEAFRYFMLREMVFGEDASFTEGMLVERINTDLGPDERRVS